MINKKNNAIEDINKLIKRMIDYDIFIEFLIV